MDEKLQQVDDVVILQLKIEGKPVDNRSKTMGRDLKYDYFTIQLFLVEVERKLAHGHPSYKFTWRDEFASDALRFSIADLIGAIDERTK
jgi:hypothetical protein